MSQTVRKTSNLAIVPKLYLRIKWGRKGGKGEISRLGERGRGVLEVLLVWFVVQSAKRNGCRGWCIREGV